MFVTLMYHLVSDDCQGPMIVSCAAFREQLRLCDQLGVSLLSLSRAARILDGEAAPPRAVLLSFDDGYRNSVDKVLPILQECGAPALLSLCSSYLRSETLPQETIHASNEFATIPDVEKWLGAGYAIAGHSVTHPKLTELSDAEIEDEVALDQRTLQKIFGFDINSFVYPFGAFDSRVENIVGRYYRNAFADGAGAWPAPGRRLAIRRTMIRPTWTLENFQRRLEFDLLECQQTSKPPQVGAR